MKNIEKHLKNEKVTANFKNETGNRYGNLLVVDLHETRNKSAFWACECDCGKILSVAGYRLRDGSRNKCSKSCSHTVKAGSRIRVSEWATRAIVGNAA